MKTNRFEEILRRKLESLKPDFQEQDWDKFQSFQQHAAPSFWQTYGHWLGYAVAVLTTATVAVLYVNQSRQNDALLREMKELRQQVAGSVGGSPVVTDSLTSAAPESYAYKKTGETAPVAPTVPHTDTVYVIEPRVIYRDRPVYESRAERADLAESANGQSPLSSEENFDRQKSENPEKPATGNRIATKAPRALPETNTRPDKAEVIGKSSTDVAPADNRESQPGNALSGEALSKATQAITDDKPQDRLPQDRLPQDRLPQDRLVLNDIQPLPTPSLPETAKTNYRRLINRMPRVTQRQTAAVVARSEKIAESKAVPSKPAIMERPEKITKEENLLPKFGLNLPFRVGAGQQWEGRTKAFSVWNEVLLGKHWSVQTGLSWQKLEEQKFFDERIFKEKMKKDFREDHAEKLPTSFDIFNISTSTKITRIPLNLTYRNEVNHGFSYFVGAGTTVNLRARQTLSFDFKRPSRDYGQEIKERNIPFPLINNVNALVGVEKRWSPIVLQVSSFLNTRFKTFPFLDDRTDVGLQVKLLYEFKPNKK